MDDSLNDPQAAAVAHTRGPLLVFAGAGSGKTRVITYRIANLVACERVPPWRILAVTFTNKAAGEMRARLEKLCGPEVARSLWVGTFHATCAKLLRAHGAEVGVQPNFVIYDAADQKAVVGRAIKDLDLDEKRFPARAVLSQIHKQKQEGRGPDDMDRNSYVDDLARQDLQNATRSACARPTPSTSRTSSCSWRSSWPARARATASAAASTTCWSTSSRTPTPRSTASCATSSKDHKNLCVVGDDDQSIYRWRGADVRNIRGFRHDYPDATIVKLEQNYRSSKRIVAAALGVISTSRRARAEGALDGQRGRLPIHIVAARDERDEAAFVVESIRQARAEGVDPEEIAVFYRIHAQSRVLEEALRAAQRALPDRRRHQVLRARRGQGRARVPARARQPAQRRRPRCGSSTSRRAASAQTTVDRLTAWADARAACSLFDALGRVDEIEDLAAPRRRSSTPSASSSHALRVRRRPGRAERAARPRCSTQTGYSAALEKEDTAEADARIENLSELAGSLQDYEAEAEAAGEPLTLAGFLERVTLVSDVDGSRTAGGSR